MARKFTITFTAIAIGIFPLFIFITTFINLKLIVTPNVMNEILDSINAYPITGFINYTTSNYCTNGYVSPTLYKFPGSQHGCSCVYADKGYPLLQSHKYEVFPGVCDYNQTKNGCKELQSIKEEDLYIWKNGRFCYEHYDEGKANGYLDFLKHSVLEGETCEEGYQNCGLLDNNGNYLCIPKGDSCPINDIIFSNYERVDLNEKYEKTNIGNNYFYYSNTSSQKPVILDLKVSENKLCLFKDYYHTDYPQYILDNNFGKYGCKYKINGNFYLKDLEVIDMRTKYNLYEDSNINLYQIYSGEHDFPFNSLIEEMILYPKRYIGFDKKCLLKNGGLDLETFAYNEKTFEGIISYSNKMIKINKIIMWFSFFSFIIEFMASSIFDLDRGEKWVFLLLWCIVDCLCYIGMAVPIFINLKNIKNCSIIPLCGDTLLNDKISNYNKISKEFKITTIIQTVLVNSQILFMIIIVIIIKFYQYGDLPQPLINKNEDTENTNKKIEITNQKPEKPYYSPGYSPEENQNYENRKDDPNIKDNEKTSGIDE